MREIELELMELIEENPIISQREIAKRVSLSLGMVNILLKQCVEKGFVKLENINTRTVKYILTPEGINEKAKKSINYIKFAYSRIKKVTEKMEFIFEKYENRNIYITSKKDEIYDIVMQISKFRGKEIEIFETIDEITINDSTIVVLWDNEIEEKCMERAINYVNIFK